VSKVCVAEGEEHVADIAIWSQQIPVHHSCSWEDAQGSNVCACVCVVGRLRDVAYRKNVNFTTIDSFIHGIQTVWLLLNFFVREVNPWAHATCIADCTSLTIIHVFIL